mmetsp:Transcript_35051/g.51471  ORF Transcript_35051/g.51471 Transcript_35051/m.51471 type:complete len:559 (+) Transcript_35051:145-1821(+)
MVKISAFAVYCLGLQAVGFHVNAFSFSAVRHVSRSTSFIAPSAVAFTKNAPRCTTSLSMMSEETSAGGSKMVRLPGSAVEITITVSGDETQNAYDRTLKELSKEISIPGFRKGAKIPPAVLENAMAAKGGRNAIRVQAIKALLGALVEPAVKEEHKLEPIGQPTLKVKTEELAEDYVPGEELDMVVCVDVWPDTKFKEIEGKEKPYLGLTGKYKRKPFNQEKFDAAIVDLRDRYATLEPMEDGTKLDWGNACVVNMDGFMANADGSKGEPLPNAASGDNVEVVLGEGRYMEGLVEGLIGASVGETKVVYVSFPERLKDKTLAGKQAVFDVNVLQASNRVIPELDDDFANTVRPGLDLESLKAELRKAIDDEDAKEYVEDRNKALSKSLADIVDMDVPDTIVTQQAREKYATMMTDFRDNGMDDAEIKKMITPENFLKYKDIAAPDIITDFKVSMGVEHIAISENIEVPAYQVDEQMGQLQKEAEGEEFDEVAIRGKVEATLQRRLVFDYLAEHADLEVEYIEEEEIDTELLEQLAADTLKREEETAAAAAAAADSEAS